MVTLRNRTWMIVGLALVLAGCTDDSERPADATSDADVASETDAASDSDVGSDTDVASGEDVADTPGDVFDVRLPDTGDTSDTDAAADARLEDVVPEGCGDGTRAPWEECDDWNHVSGDGCSSACRVEPGWSCDGPSIGCTRPCGDSIVRGDEECDDGNSRSGDGCSVTCRLEPGWECHGTPTRCVSLCGNGEGDPGEACDDGNDSRLDGCHECTVTEGWRCTETFPSECTSLCGDGVIDAGEECDDAGTTPGCERCEIVDGWLCEGEPSTCEFVCGNGELDALETCDDGNATDGDGCSAACRVEAGWECAPGLPSDCGRICGNGRADGGESCDDGNSDDLDGCSSACEVEARWACDGEWPTECERICGNGELDPGEECDTGGVGSGCPSCVVAQTWSCSGTPSVCVTSCGDGLLDAGEECDDGDAASPGCLGCVVTPGWACSGSPSTCEALCGDGVVDAVEECDDGNLTNGDGCSAECLDEACGNGVLDDGEACDGVEGCGERCEPRVGWTCVDGSCHSYAMVCGNGRLDVSFGEVAWGTVELCDDGNTEDGDGCSARCQLEEGWTCLDEPSVCEPSCGTAWDDGPCTDARNAPDGGCEPVPRPWGTHCALDGASGYCDQFGACLPGSACAELPDGSPCEDGTGALDLRCTDGACTVDSTVACDNGVRIGGRCWPRARRWGNPIVESAGAWSTTAGEWGWSSIEATSPAGVGRRSPGSFGQGYGEVSVDSPGCELIEPAYPSDCAHACAWASASGTHGYRRRRIPPGASASSGASMVMYASAHASRTSGPVNASASARMEGFDFGDCPFWACDTWAMVDGECVSTCPGAMECDGGWTNVDDDHENCGECGVVCADDHTCMDGLCVCRFDTETDPDHCGACGNACDAGASCVEGECVCPFDTESDPDNCGACGNVCPERHSCVEGVCGCDADVVAENPAACDGCPTGFTGRYCELACPVGSLGEPCGGPDYGVCVTRDGAAVCDCFDGGPSVQPNCEGGYPECTLESSHPW